MSNPSTSVPVQVSITKEDILKELQEMGMTDLLNKVKQVFIDDQERMKQSMDDQERARLCAGFLTSFGLPPLGYGSDGKPSDSSSSKSQPTDRSGSSSRTDSTRSSRSKRGKNAAAPPGRSSPLLQLNPSGANSNPRRSNRRSEPATAPAADAVNAIDIVETEFCPLDSWTIERLKSADRKSKIWQMHKLQNAKGLYWSNEAIVSHYVTEVFNEIMTLAYSSHPDSHFPLVFKNEYDLEVFDASDPNRRADLGICHEVSKVLLSVCEVKRPIYKAQYRKYLSWDFESAKSQIYNNLMSMHHYHGIRFPFLIVTTYMEWRVYWLPGAADEFASARNLDDAAKAAKATPVPVPDPEPEAKADPLPAKRVLHCTRRFKHSEPALVELLVSFFKKLEVLPVERPKSLLDVLNRRLYYEIKADTAEESQVEGKWARLGVKPLSLIPPSDQTFCYFLLQDYHGGRDGRVWLACSRSGQLAVLKFLKQPSSGSRDLMADAEAEAQLWNDFWGAKAFVKTFSGFNANPCIVMPFVFHGRVQHDRDGGSQRFNFSSPNHWRIEEKVKAPFDPDLMKQEFDAVFEPQVYTSEYLKPMDDHEPNLSAAEAAIRQMYNAGFKHCDLRWRHVGLLPVWCGSGNRYTVKPVLIDLTDVAPLTEEDEANSAFVQDCIEELKQNSKPNP